MPMPLGLEYVKLGQPVPYVFPVGEAQRPRRQNASGVALSWHRQLPDRRRRPDALQRRQRLRPPVRSRVRRRGAVAAAVRPHRRRPEDVGPLLDFDRQATRFHVAGHKLQLLADYYWVTRDKDVLKETRPKWEPVVASSATSRKTENGLLPKDNYAGDVNSRCTRSTRTPPAGAASRHGRRAGRPRREGHGARSLRKEADEFRKAILDAVGARASDAKEKFVPVALLGDEPAARPAHRHPPGQLLRPHHPLRPRLGGVRPRRRARGRGSSTTCARTAGSRWG